MKIRSQKSEVRRLICSGITLTVVLQLFAASDSEVTDKSLKLLPPYGQLPPTFWEQHRTAVLIAAIAVIAIAGFVIWLWRRPRPTAVLPPETQARGALTALANRAEDGALLSSVSQILRRYIITAFGLPRGEPTTAEFSRALANEQRIGPELSSAVSDFMRQCDERKFAPQNHPAPMKAVNRALELVALGEARLTQLQQPVATTKA